MYICKKKMYNVSDSKREKKRKEELSMKIIIKK